MHKVRMCVSCLVAVSCAAVVLSGCRETVIIYARVNTQRASLKEITKGTTSNHFGGLTARVDFALAEQRSMMSRLDRATEAARGIQSQANQLATAWGEAARAEAQAACGEMQAARDEAQDADLSGILNTSGAPDADPSGG